MHGIDFPKCGPHLPYLCDKARRQRSEGDVSLLQIYPFFAKRQEKISSRIRIDDRLEAEFRLVHLQRGRGLHRIVPRYSDKVSDRTDVGIQCLGGAAPSSSERDCLCLAQRRSGGWRGWYRLRGCFRCGCGRRRG